MVDVKNTESKSEAGAGPLPHNVHSGPHAETYQRILNVAEGLFAKNGFSATSMRGITSEAGVNLASVNYYFGSKENLIVQVLSRAIRPFNEERLSHLNAAISKSMPNPVPLQEVLHALIQPCFNMCFDPTKQQVFQLMGRSLSEEGEFIKEVVNKEWHPILAKFNPHLRAALPHLTEEEIFWRLHFTMGAVIHTGCHHQQLTLMSAGLCRPDGARTLKQIIDYATAGLLAPGSK